MSTTFNAFFKGLLAVLFFIATTQTRGETNLFSENDIFKTLKLDWIYEIEEDSLTAEILQNNAKTISTLEKTPIIEPNKNYWFRFTVTSNTPDDLLLILLRHYESTLYYQDSDGTWQNHAASYKDFENYRKNIFYNTFLKIPTNKKSNTYYLHIKSRVTTGLGVMLALAAPAFHMEIDMYLVLGAYLGLLFIVLIYSGILFIKTFERLYLYYFLLLIGLFSYAGLTVTSIGDLLYKSRNDYFFHTLITVAITIVSLLYAREYLNIKEKSPRFNLLLFAVIYIRIIFFVAGTFFNLPVLNSMDIEALCFILPIIVSFISYRRGENTASFIFVAFSITAISFVIREHFNERELFNELLKIPFVQKHPYLIYYYDGIFLSFIASSVDIVLFTISISERIIRLRRENEKERQTTIELQSQIIDIKDSYNLDLENKIEEQTLKLKEAYEVINSMNKELTIDNKNLVKNIEVISKARILEKVVSFEDFCKTIPDNNACLEFVANLKWKSGFKCKRCGYKKFYEGDLLFGKRCKVCQYKETATAHTLLDNVKFPLQKALYVIYTVHSFEKVNIKALSESLDLRHATCLKLSNRTMEAKVLLKSSKKSSDDWTSLLLIATPKVKIEDEQTVA